MKKLMLIITLSILCSSAFTVSADNDITITIDNEKVDCDIKPIMANDRVLVPMRDIFEKLEAKVYWLDEEKQALASKGQTDVKFTIGSSSMTKTDYSIQKDTETNYFVDGIYKKNTVIELDVPTQIIENKTFIPLRAISEAFGYTVIWDDMFRTVSVQSPMPTDQNEIIAILLKYNIISEDDIDKDLYITNLEALQAIRRIITGSTHKADLKNWYYGDMLEPLDYLDDDTKELLLSISDNRDILKTEEILNTDIHANLKEYQALVYLTRMIGNTYGCTDYPDELNFTEQSQTYSRAVEKGLINTADMTNADKTITRNDFYALLVKAAYTPFISGGSAGAHERRYIDILKRYTEHIVSATPKPEEKELKKINIHTEFDDDMSLHWIMPDEYKNSTTHVSYITSENEIKSFVMSLHTCDKFDTDEIIKMISYNDWNIPKAIRCEYSNDNGRIFFDIDLSNIELIRENYTIEPGIYTPFERQWVPQYITLANNYSFKKGAYYMLISYNHDYRLPKYNHTSQMIIKSEENTAIFSNANHDTFKCGGIDFDDMHIREIIIESNLNKNFKIHVSEESNKIFEINKE